MTGKVSQEFRFLLIEGARVQVSIGQAGAAQGRLALGAITLINAEELILVIVAGNLGDVLEVAPLEEAATLVTTLEGVAINLCPDTVNSVEESVAVQRGSSAGGEVNVIV